MRNVVHIIKAKIQLKWKLQSIKLHVYLCHFGCFLMNFTGHELLILCCFCLLFCLFAVLFAFFVCLMVFDEPYCPWPLHPSCWCSWEDLIASPSLHSSQSSQHSNNPRSSRGPWCWWCWWWGEQICWWFNAPGRKFWAFTSWIEANPACGSSLLQLSKYNIWHGKYKWKYKYK